MIGIMAALGLARAGIGAATSIGGFLSGQKSRKRKFGATARGEELKKLMAQGAISPEMEAEIIGSQNRRGAALAQTETAARRGELVAAGLEGSIAGRRFVREPQTERRRDLGATSRRIAAENAQSKMEAERTFSKERAGFQEQQQLAKQQALQQLIAGVGGAASEAVGGFMQQKQADITRGRQDAALEENKRRYELGRSDLSSQRIEDRQIAVDDLQLWFEYQRLLDLPNGPDKEKALEDFIKRLQGGG